MSATNGPVRTVLKGGTVLDATGERRADVLLEGDRILAVDEGLDAPVVLDASGCLVAPGLVDLHTHLRQPGREDASMAAAPWRGERRCR